jgi:hypothetical protein
LSILWLITIASDRELTKQLGQVEEQAQAHGRKQKELANMSSRLSTQFNIPQRDRREAKDGLEHFDYVANTHFVVSISHSTTDRSKLIMQLFTNVG